jgi:L-fuculose-phosphate aldolase
MTLVDQSTRERICEIGRLLYDRRLTDAAGGNISVRIDDHICITPRYAGSQFQWRLNPDQVLVTDHDGNKLEGNGELSRESKVHFKLYREFPDGNAVIHCHAEHVLDFCAAGVPIVPVLESTLKFGEIGLCAFAPAHSKELADSITAELHNKEKALKIQAAAVMAPWHGLFVLGKNLDAAFDAAERIDGNARILLTSSLFWSIDEKIPGLKDRSELLKQESAKFGKEF